MTPPEIKRIIDQLPDADKGKVSRFVLHSNLVLLLRCSSLDTDLARPEILQLSSWLISKSYKLKYQI